MELSPPLHSLRKNRCFRCFLVFVVTLVVIVLPLCYLVIVPSIVATAGNFGVDDVQLHQINITWIGQEEIDFSVDASLIFKRPIPMDVTVLGEKWAIKRTKGDKLVRLAKVPLPEFSLAKNAEKTHLIFSSSLYSLHISSLAEFMNSVADLRENSPVEIWTLSGNPRLKWGQIGVNIPIVKQTSFSPSKLFGTAEFNITVLQILLTLPNKFSMDLSFISPFHINVVPQNVSVSCGVYTNGKHLGSIRTPRGMGLSFGTNNVSLSGDFIYENFNEMEQIITEYMEGKTITLTVQDVALTTQDDRARIKWLEDSAAKWVIPLSFAKNSSSAMSLLGLNFSNLIEEIVKFDADSMNDAASDLFAMFGARQKSQLP